MSTPITTNYTVMQRSRQLFPLLLAVATAAVPLNVSAQDVSFSKDIAPILRDNCKGCHIGGGQASGGLSMNTFTQLSRGGGNGGPLNSSAAEQSLIVQKLTGKASGQRMPAGGRPPLGDEQIRLITSWIRQGAKFDGPNPDTDINSVIDLARVSDASHADLLQERKARAQETWKQAFPNQEPQMLETGELAILGNVSEAKMQEIKKEFEKVLVNADELGMTVRSRKLKQTNPVIHGGLVVFVLKSRYDYSEFGKMIEKRELPRGWVGHWRANPVDAYAVVVYDNAASAPPVGLAHQLIIGAYWGGKPGVPYWFAEGLARNQIPVKSRKDYRIAAWAFEANHAVNRATNVKAIVDGELDEETQGLIGLKITESMMARNNVQQFRALVSQLRKGIPFPEAMSKSFGDTEAFIKYWLGK